MKLYQLLDILSEDNMIRIFDINSKVIYYGFICHFKNKVENMLSGILICEICNKVKILDDNVININLKCIYGG